MTGYNLETGITTLIEAEVVQEGSLVLSARLFGEIVRKLPDDVVSVSTDGNNVSIVCGPTSFDIVGSDPREFPELPEVDEGNTLSISQEKLKSMISRVIFAVSDNESRPIHTGALFEVEGEELTMVAVDGYRLALRREAISGKEGAGTFSFVVPGAALSEVEKICSDCDQAVSITEGRRHVTFQIGSTVLVARRLEGSSSTTVRQFPRTLLSVEADTKTLQVSIDRASLIIKIN